MAIASKAHRTARRTRIWP